jgi:hypothetical protein
VQLRFAVAREQRLTAELLLPAQLRGAGLQAAFATNAIGRYFSPNLPILLEAAHENAQDTDNFLVTVGGDRLNKFERSG